MSVCEFTTYVTKEQNMQTAMTDRQFDTTHSHVCWSWGPRHYECALREIERLRAEVAEWKARADDLAAALNKCIKLAYIRDLDELPSAIIMTATRAVDKYDMLADLGD